MLDCSRDPRRHICTLSPQTRLKLKKIIRLDDTLIAKLTKKSYLTTVVALQLVDPEGTDKDNDC